MESEETKEVPGHEGKDRIEACKTDLAELLARHKCALDVSCLIKSGGAQFMIEIKPIE